MERICFGYAQNMRNYYIILGCVLALGVQAQEQVYKSTGSDGVVEFSDQPSSGAKTITVTPNVVTLPESPRFQPATKQAPEPTYTSLTITAPQNDEAIRSNAGNFAATAEIEPELLGGDSIQWLFDGQVIKGANATFLTMTNVDRGTHTVQIQVINTDGEVVKSSETITFHLQRFAGG